MSATPPMLHRIKRLAAVIFSLAVFFSGLSCHRIQSPQITPVVSTKSATGEPLVRVRLLEDVPAVRLGGGAHGVLFRDARSGSDIAMLASDQGWDAVRFGKKAQLRVAMPDGRVSLDHPDGVLAEGPSGAPVTVNGTAYRGKIYVYSMPNGNLRVVNVLPLEDYLRSVVPAEIGTLDEQYIQALKAQAVVARSFALARMQESKGVEFDVTGDTGDQVYRGIAKESPATDRAVLSTRGQALSYQGRVISAFYHSTCGGRTADPGEAWGRDFAAGTGFLSSVDDNDYDRGSRWQNWQVKWTRHELLDQIKKYLPAAAGISSDEMGQPTDIEVREHGPSGRVTLLMVTTDKRSVPVRCDQIRRVLRQNSGAMLPSTLFSLSIEKGKGEPVVTAVGHGFGHGLGMCQWGARTRAEAGQDYQKILKAYYKDVKLEKLY